MNTEEINKLIADFLRKSADDADTVNDFGYLTICREQQYREEGARKLTAKLKKFLQDNGVKDNDLR